MAPRLSPSRETSRHTRTDGVTSATTADSMEECDKSSGPNEVGLNGKPAESSTAMVSPTLGSKDTTSTELWVLCPQNFSSVLQKAFKANHIGATELFISTMQEHEIYQRYLEFIKKHRVNLIIELPIRKEGEGG